MAVVLTFAGASPVVKVGRIAGQFAKPRSAPTETVGGVELPSYRGDIINGIEFTPEARTPDPRAPDRGLPPVGRDAEPAARLRDRRLRQPRERRIAGCSASSKDSPQSATLPASSPTASPRRSTSCAPSASTRRPIRRCASTDFYTSHEALLLGYEQAMTRVNSTTGDWYATSGHMIWIGDRTRQPDHAHVEYLPRHQEPDRPEMRPVARRRTSSLRLIDMLNPENEPGRLTLICRFGADKVVDHLPALVRAVKREGRAVVWSCDPMHGNTIKAGSRLQDAAVRARSCRRSADFFAVHQAEGTHAGGVHLEMTGKNVTECTGGARALTRRGSARPLPHLLRPAPQRRAGARAGFPDRRIDQARAPGAGAAEGRGGGVGRGRNKKDGLWAVLFAPRAVMGARRAITGATSVLSAGSRGRTGSG